MNVETKFDVGDILWYERENRDNQLELVKVRVMEIQLAPEIYYKIRRVAPHENVEYTVLENTLARTKTEFIKDEVLA